MSVEESGVVSSSRLRKCPTGIRGLDEITQGGLPRGRPTLVCGAAGTGKTMLAMEFLVRGATRFDEPGAFISFEESGLELTQNMASLGFDLPSLEKAGKIALDFVFIERSQIEETGEYDLKALLIRIKYASIALGPSGWFWTRWRPCSEACPTSWSCGRNCGACSGGLRTLASPP